MYGVMALVWYTLCTRDVHMQVTSDTLIASVTQSELEPGRESPGVADLVQRLQLFKEEFS